MKTNSTKKYIRAKDPFRKTILHNEFREYLNQISKILKSGKALLYLGHSMVGHAVGFKSKILNSFKFPPLIQLIEKRKS